MCVSFYTQSNLRGLRPTNVQAPQKRGPLATLVALFKAFFASLFDPNVGRTPKKQSNVHGVYDDDSTVTSKRARRRGAPSRKLSLFFLGNRNSFARRTRRKEDHTISRYLGRLGRTTRPRAMSPSPSAAAAARRPRRRNDDDDECSPPKPPQPRPAFESISSRSIEPVRVRGFYSKIHAQAAAEGKGARARPRLERELDRTMPRTRQHGSRRRFPFARYHKAQSFI